MQPHQHNEAKAFIWCIWLVVLTLHEIVGIADPTAPLSKFLGAVSLCPKEVSKAVIFNPSPHIDHALDGVSGMLMTNTAAQTTDRRAARKGNVRKHLWRQCDG